MIKKKGFTLVELLAVIVVLAIILAIAVPGIANIINNSTRRAFNLDAQMILKAIEYKKLEDNTFNPLEITKENMKNTIGISDENYEQVNISTSDSNIGVEIIVETSGPVLLLMEQ
jgi:type IV pilus assembly protein PilA